MISTSAIYAIRNNNNGKFYIGSAINIKNRWYNHKKELEQNRHHSKYLQNSYNKNHTFQFLIIEFCSKEKTLEREQWWLDLTQCWKPEVGYNSCKTAGSFLGFKQSKDHINKRIKRGYKQTPDRALISRTARKGKLHSEETKKKMSEKRKNVKRPYLKIVKWPCNDGNRCKCDRCREQRNLDQKLKYHERKSASIIKQESSIKTVSRLGRNDR